MTDTVLRDPWLKTVHPNPQAGLTLFCFPFAGGGASVFARWGQMVPAGIEVCGVQPPGREERLGEPAFRTADALVADLLPRIAPLSDRPYALFGHSMGAFLAYETAQALSARGRPPAHLFVSAQRAPQLPLNRPVSYDLPDAGFEARLRALNGTADAALQSRELMELVMPLLRSDFELSETYARRQQPPLTCPITVFGGTGDDEVDRDGLEAWAEATQGPVELQMFDGDHFFLRSHAQQLVAALGRALARHTS